MKQYFHTVVSLLFEELVAGDSLGFFICGCDGDHVAGVRTSGTTRNAANAVHELFQRLLIQLGQSNAFLKVRADCCVGTD